MFRKDGFDEFGNPVSCFDLSMPSKPVITPNQTKDIHQGREFMEALTLITCENYNEGNNTYANRIAVQAVLIKTETSTSQPESGRLR